MKVSLIKWLRDLAGLDDPPHKIALGLALGIFIGFVPIMGIQMAVVLPFAFLFGGNKTAAISGVWITNPITVIPIYYINYKVGLLFTPFEPLSKTYFSDLFDHLTISRFLRLGQDVLMPLFAGGIAIGVVASIPTYFVTKRMVVRYRLKRKERKERRERKRTERAEKDATEPPA
jgi:uncharacterized protein (DUF2062 family)